MNHDDVSLKQIGPVAQSPTTEIRQVRVTYGRGGGGLRLAAVSDPAVSGPAVSDTAVSGPVNSRSSDESVGCESTVDGVLRIGEGCVTLELPTADGKVSLLAWDPAEVGLDDVGLAVAG